MSAIYYTIVGRYEQLENLPLLWIIIHAKFREDLLSNNKVSLQGHDFDRSVYMTAICYSGSMSAVLANEKFFGEKNTCV